ncbi:hypothetical protein GW17_00013216 [Ensete ventricosum]|nr:hypothetical protein GW17_00013216 [Ensete ventricosum]
MYIILYIQKQLRDGEWKRYRGIGNGRSSISVPQVTEPIPILDSYSPASPLNPTPASRPPHRRLRRLSRILLRSPPLSRWYVDVDFVLPPCFLGNGSERATGGILEEFLARHGKALDAAMEEKRLGKMHKESAVAIVQDYGLLMTPEEFSEAIMPLFQER